MRVVIFSHEWPPVGGGMGTSLRSFVEGTEALRDEYDVVIDVIVPSESNHTSLQFAHRAVITHVGVGKRADKKGRRLAALRWLWQVNRLKLDYDVMHVWGGMPNVWLARKPFILTLHGDDVPGRNPHCRHWYWLAGRSYERHWRRAKAITAVTPHLAQLASEFCGRAVHSIPHGTTMPESIARTLHRPLRLLAVTRLAPLKNVVHLTQIAGLMGDKARLRVVGDGPDMKFYRDTGLRNTEWVGWQKDLDEHYRWADIFVNATSATGMGCAMMEAKSYGLPVVALMFPGCDDIPGVYPCSDDGVSYVRAINWVAEHYDEALRKAQQGIGDLSWARRARPYFELYRQVAGGD